MNLLKCEYLEFVPGKLVCGEDGTDVQEDVIYVYAKREGNRIYKRKRFHIAWITYDKKRKHWVFVPCEGRGFYFETLIYIGGFINRLESKSIKFNAKKGELKNLYE